MLHIYEKSTNAWYEFYTLLYRIDISSLKNRFAELIEAVKSI